MNRRVRATPPADLLDLYLPSRMGHVEQVFQAGDRQHVRRLQHLIGCSPAGPSCMQRSGSALLLYNMMQVVQLAVEVARVHGGVLVAVVSMHYLFDQQRVRQLPGVPDLARHRISRS